MRNIAEIGAMWPRCTECGHIAQSHDRNKAEATDQPACCESTNGQCPTCHTWQKIPCQCKGYNGPTLEEFKKLLTPEEIKYHRI